MNITQEPSVSRRANAALARFHRDVLHGLRQPAKELPCKYLYDERGARLFDEICTLDEYYPTRTELGILCTHIDEIADRIGPDCLLMEFGSGSSLKTRLLLDQLHRPAVYVPIDIAEPHLRQAAAALEQRYPALEVLPVCADFTQPVQLPECPRWAAQRAMFFPGSTIGNFHPRDAVTLLRRIRGLCGTDGGLVIGVDLKKERTLLERAYNDARGITAAFNLNLLQRINRELHADFQLDKFEHRAIYNAGPGRIEMHLTSRGRQKVNLGEASFKFTAGETILTECSYKYTVAEFTILAAAAGFAMQDVWMDPRQLFAVLFLR